MCMDIIKNKLFYKRLNDLCDCEYCIFFRDNISKEYKDLSQMLSNWGIDISKAFEIAIPYLDNNKLIFPFAQYLVMGKYNESILKNITDDKIILAKNYPDPQISEDYFVIELGPIVFDKSLVNEEILDQLGE